VVFLYSKKPEFAAAARALKIRGVMSFGENPIPGKFEYKAFYADLTKFDADTYASYKMLVTDYYASDIREKFNAVFPGLDYAAIPASIHNPDAYLEAKRPVVDFLINKYRNTTSPLEFYGSRHMAEGVAILLDCLNHAELKGGILADEMGLGKTAQSIITAIEAGKLRVLVVAPKTAIAATWPQEIKRVSKNLTWLFCDHDAPGKYNVQFELVSWDSLRLMPGQSEIFAIEEAQRETDSELPENTLQRLAAVRENVVKEYASKFDLIIADESHRAKHNFSARSTALRNIANFVPDLLLLTGTPVTKKPKDILHLLQLIHHPLAQKPGAFLARYSPESKGFTESKVASKQRLEELHVLLRDCYLRREKSQTNLPPKTRYVEKVELKPAVFADIERRWKEYCVEKADEMKNPKYPLAMVRTMKYRQWLALHKVDALSEWLENLLDAGEKVVVFTCFEESFQAYMKKYAKICVGINGQTSSAARAKAVQAFQEDPLKTLFVGNIQAAGESATMTAAAHLGFNDLPWLPTEVLQGEDRVCRGGQTRPTGIYFFLANHKCDEDGFADFLASKEVVQTVTNRRDAEGRIHDAEWKGMTGDLDLPGLDLGMSRGEDFDWEDAGEDPPPQKEISRAQQSKDFVQQQIRIRQMQQARAAGTVFGKTEGGRGPTAMSVLRKQLPAGRDGNRIINTDILAVQRFLTDPWEIDFAKSILAWLRTGKPLSQKQRDVAIKIIARNRKYLI